ASVGSPCGGDPTTMALGRRQRDRDRRESPVPRLAGILRFATVPTLEHRVVLRRLGRDRRSVLLGGAAHGARVGRPATLGTGARVPHRARRGHDVGVVAWPRPRRVVGTGDDGRCAAAGVVGWTRHWFGVAGRRRAAAYGLVVLAAYVVANAGVSVVAKAQIRAAAAQRFGPDARWAALPIVGRPLRWEGLSASPDSVPGRWWA